MVFFFREKGFKLKDFYPYTINGLNLICESNNSFTLESCSICLLTILCHVLLFLYRFYCCFVLLLLYFFITAGVVYLLTAAHSLALHTFYDSLPTPSCLLRVVSFPPQRGTRLSAHSCATIIKAFDLIWFWLASVGRINGRVFACERCCLIGRLLCWSWTNKVSNHRRWDNMYSEKSDRAHSN